MEIVQLTPDVVTLTGAAAHILVPQEALEVDLVAGVLAGLAISAGAGARSLIAVHVEDAIGLLLLTEGDLALLDDGHGEGIGGVGRLEVLLVELRSVDLLSHRGGSQSGEENGGEAGLHLDAIVQLD